MNKLRTLFTALFVMFLAEPTQAQEGTCFPECRPGFVCSPANVCTSICNPPCSDTQICTAEARCIDNPAAQPPAPAPEPVQQVPPTAEPSRNDYEVPPAPPVDRTPSLLVAPGAFRLHIGLELGFGGELGIDGEDTDVELNPTVGVNINGVVPFGRYLIVGPNAFFRSYKFKDADERLHAFGIGATVGVHYALDAGGVAVDPFFLFTLGLGMLLPDDDTTEELEFGVNFGLRGGVRLWFSESFGVSASLGYQRMDVFADDGRSDSIRLSLGQFAMEFGAAIRFGN